MHLSKELQRRLDKLNSNVNLATTIDGTLPDKHAFYNKPGRSFRAAFASSINDYSIVLYERTDNQNYEHCFARALFTDLDRLATVIDLWVEKQESILEIKHKFNELELYDDFDIKNPNKDINAAWTKVKNMFFNDTEFWKQPEWNERYLEMLNEAIQHQSFENYFPFTSHYNLRFSIDKDINETWDLNTFIIPIINYNKDSNTPGKFYVSYNDQPMGGAYFETAKEGLDFYASKLNKTKNQ